MDVNKLCLGCMSDKGEAVTCPFCGWTAQNDLNLGQGLAPGTILRGKYLLGRVLGQGGFGITYLAWDLDLNLKLAIKEYLPRDYATRSPGASDVSIYTSQNAQTFFDEGRDKFLEEARTLARFEDHPGIVSIRDFFRENRTAYFVMNYIEGSTLKEYLKEQGGCLSFDMTMQMMMPVMDALEAVHQAGVLHRDISPDNIFITGKGQVKILDFGAARQAMGEHSKSLSVILKPGYAPEEQYRSKGNQGSWTDVYATAATFYRALTGQIPPESLDRMASDTMPRPSQLGIAIPPESENALIKALAIRAEERFQNMRQFQQALAAGWYAAGTAASSGTSPVKSVYIRGEAETRPAIEPARPGSGKTIILITAVLIVAAVAAFWFIKGSLTPQYSGGLVEGKKSGFGVLTMPNGDRYEGEWKNDFQNGSGIFTYANGDRYDGQWLNGNRHGKGTFTWADGRRYVGDWRDDQRNGRGIYTWPGGDRYEGEFKEGRLNGRGVYTYSNGKVVEGVWQNDNYMGK